MDTSFSANQQKIQEALNQAKKRELEEKYGARFSETSNLPPEIEEQWLSNIEEFERQHQNSKEITVREYLGNPAFPPLETIPEENLERELESVLEFLASQDIVVDTLAEVPDEELYRFVTTEFMEAEINDMRVPGWTHHYIYEEFHPNDEYDAKSCSEHFLSALFAREEEMALGALQSEKADPAGARVELVKSIRSFHSRFVSFPQREFTCTDCRLDGDHAVVTLNIRWTGLRSGSLEGVSHEGTGEIRLRKSPYGMYDVSEALIPGFREDS